MTAWWQCWVQLSEHHGDDAGQWFYENGYGQLDGMDHPIFGNLDAAKDYITSRLAAALSPANP
jgi:hypothetical protein